MGNEMGSEIEGVDLDDSKLTLMLVIFASRVLARRSRRTSD